MTEITNTPRIWIRSFYGFNPEDDGYIGWSQKVARDRMLPLLQPGDLVMIYGAGSSETETAQRSYVLGFLEVEAEPIRDFEKSSELALTEKRKRGWGEKWTHALPVKRAWRTTEKVLISRVATVTYRPEAGQSIGVWGALMTDEECERALRLRVIEVSVFGEPPIDNDGIRNDEFAKVFRPSRAFPGSFGERVSRYEDGETWLYLTRFEGDGLALLGRPRSPAEKSSVIKIGITNEPKRRTAQLNAGFPPAAIGKWGPPLLSRPYPTRSSAEIAEQEFKNLASEKLTSLGGEFFLGDWMGATLLFANIRGVSRFD